jgi:hypothetical protein
MSYRIVQMIVNRTLLALEPDILAAIDAELAHALATWGPRSRYKTEQAIDAVVERHDPAARRRVEATVRSRYVDIEHRGGIAALYGEVQSTDATLLDRRLTALAHTVCANDPRTIDQRRADAMGALAAGHTTLICACGQPDCTAPESVTTTSVVVHVVAEAAALDGATGADLHGEQPGDGGPEIVRDPERFAELIREATRGRPTAQPRTAPLRRAPNPGFVLGGALIPAEILADLAARGAAEIRPLIHPGDSPPEPRYRPSAALADFVRCRDLTCRFIGCDRPAEFCDVDHTIPYDAGGLTHASNLKCLCRKHHLLNMHAGAERRTPCHAQVEGAGTLVRTGGVVGEWNAKSTTPATASTTLSAINTVATMPQTYPATTWPRPPMVPPEESISLSARRPITHANGPNTWQNTKPRMPSTRMVVAWGWSAGTGWP